MPDRGIPRKFEQKLRLVSYGKRQQEPPPLANFWRKAEGEKAKTETCHWLLEQNQIYISFAFNHRRFVMFFQVVTSLRVLVRFEVM
jgi:hypothetical protein